MGSHMVSRVAELVMRVFAAASLVGIGAFAVLSSGIGMGLPQGTPDWVKGAIHATPMGADRFEPSILTEAVRVGDNQLLFEVDRQIATSMLEPGRVQLPTGEGYLGARGVSVGAEGTFRVEFLDLPWWASVVMATTTAVAAVLLAGFCWTVANLLRSARGRPPFTERNARRLQILGALAALGPTLWRVADHAVNLHLLASSPAADRFVPLEAWWQVPNYTTIATGLVLLALAAIWRHGIALEKDVEGLV